MSTTTATTNAISNTDTIVLQLEELLLLAVKGHLVRVTIYIYILHCYFIVMGYCVTFIQTRSYRAYIWEGRVRNSNFLTREYTAVSMQGGWRNYFLK